MDLGAEELKDLEYAKSFEDPVIIGAMQILICILACNLVFTRTIWKHENNILFNPYTIGK